MIDSKFLVKYKIDQGTFGVVYQVVDQATGTEWVLKEDKHVQPISTVINEAKWLLFLSRLDVDCVPKFHHYGITPTGSPYVCIESLGPSINDLHFFCGRTFSAKTTLMLGKKILLAL